MLAELDKATKGGNQSRLERDEEIVALKDDLLGPASPLDEVRRLVVDVLHSQYSLHVPQLAAHTPPGRFRSAAHLPLLACLRYWYFKMIGRLA